MHNKRCRKSSIHAFVLSTAFAVFASTALSANDNKAQAALLGNLVQRALGSGQHAQLSPHLSVLLQVNRAERSTPVHQLGINSAGALWLFDVCDDDRSRIVLMRVQGAAVQAYAMSATGGLLKAVTYQVGGSTQVLSLAQAQDAFNGHLEFWTGQERALEGMH